MSLASREADGRQDTFVPWLFVEMGLTGACSNQDALGMLGKAEESRARLLGSASGPVAPAPFVVFRPQPIRAIVVDVLAEASTDLRTAEVRARVEQRLGDPVSWSSVRNALVDLAGRPDCPIERVAYGRYRCRPAA